ncbi:MAG: DUF58 domain-containing protein [Myxococcota bacterium]
MNFNKLNHILIPKHTRDWENLERTRMGQFFRLLEGVFRLFSREGLLFLLCWIFLSVVSMDVGTSQYYVVWSILTGLFVGSLLCRRFLSLEGIQATFHGPPRVTVGEDISFTVEFYNHGAQTHQAIRVERPFLSWDGCYLSPMLSIDQLRPGERRRCEIVARFVARGEHHMRPVVAQALAPLGLTLGPVLTTVNSLHFLVIPKIAKIAHMEIETTQRYQPGGVALASTTGEARELVGVRPYRPGDPIRDLHARTWARIGEPAVREYQQEYFTRFGVMIDTDQGRADELPFESMLSLTAGIVAYLSRGEALLDLLVIGQDLHELTLGRSLGFLEQALDLLACVEPKDGFQLLELQSQLRGHLSRLSCVVVLSLCWDEQRQAFADWVEQQGVRCRRIHVIDGEESAFSGQHGVTQIDAQDVREKELIV